MESEGRILIERVFVVDGCRRQIGIVGLEFCVEVGDFGVVQRAVEKSEFGNVTSKRIVSGLKRPNGDIQSGSSTGVATIPGRWRTIVNKNIDFACGSGDR